MADGFENDYTSSEATRRRRPSRRLPQSTPERVEPTLLTEDFIGLALAYGNTLLFIGYEVNGLVEISVYPRYRFSSDDRVQGHLGYVHVPLGTPWEEIIPQIDDLFDLAQNNYRTAVTLRSNATKAHGSRFEFGILVYHRHISRKLAWLLVAFAQRRQSREGRGHFLG